MNARSFVPPDSHLSRADSATPTAMDNPSFKQPNSGDSDGDTKPSHSQSQPPGPSNQAQDSKGNIKPGRVLNRVPRACNACRKQKMKCEGAENPPCKRCRHGNLECLFEKPSREATLTGEAGLERIRSLENSVHEVRNMQASIHNTLSDLVHALRSSGIVPGAMGPNTPPFSRPSPHPYRGSVASPISPASNTPMEGLMSHHDPNGGMYGQSGIPYPHSRASNSRMTHRDQYGNSSYINGSPPSATTPSSSTGPYPPSLPHIYPQNGEQSSHLPPISSLTALRNGPGPGQGQLLPPHPTRKGYDHLDSPKRGRESNVTSATSTDEEEEEFPAAGLVAPLEVISGLANKAAEGAKGDQKSGRPLKRRKTHHKNPQPPHSTYPDVVAKGIIPEEEAKELFNVFYEGCSTFLPVFDANVDTYEAVRGRSAFAFDAICMVAARCRDGNSSPVYQNILQEVRNISCLTLFSPVARKEAVQAMILISGWSDNGWLSGGHAVRMALELSMDKAWPKIRRKIKNGKMGTGPEERELVIQARTFLCLYLFEHQMSYGNGRPAILKDDDSIAECMLLLQHPLSIEDDMRLVSTVELMAIREDTHNQLLPLDGPIRPDAYEILEKADYRFQSWYRDWDHKFEKKYPDANFYRQSLQIQWLFAELFHNCIVLRDLKRPEDTREMPLAQRRLAIHSMKIANQGIDMCLRGPSYRKNLKYAVHYTHATASFAASFLMRCARFFPNEIDPHRLRQDVDELGNYLFQIDSAKRYGLTLKLMLDHARRRNVLPPPTPSAKTAATTSAVRDIPQPRLSVPSQSHLIPNQGQPLTPTYQDHSMQPHLSDSLSPPIHPHQTEHHQYIPAPQPQQQVLPQMMHHVPTYAIGQEYMQYQQQHPGMVDTSLFESLNADNAPFYLSTDSLAMQPDMGMESYMLPPAQDDYPTF
ncbi:hypothetical protein SISSUDRAFT_431482 [Sistotremastrum suecicum HHB10207 ss-3]|uniref:Zn(2)-C6 fungal-type domain-containing protein n=1 Tax=Sistotremastrum suecicum HHB10207 ss-3 TaxID=1314776 RepID=A0A165YHG2_9AGAM|nr:hypothetical protein SISSUDRAFT_431482 [Sistotremastrum suecicum HHB10207 ss-3]